MYEEIKELLINKFVVIQERILSVLLQLNDEQVNWKANIASNSISNLIFLIRNEVNTKILKSRNSNELLSSRDQAFYKSICFTQ